MSTPIVSFSGPYRFLSNFYPAQIYYDGVYYPTLEHAYQAAKTLNGVDRELIRGAATPGEAKTRGRRVTKRPHWDAIKLDVMERLLRGKFRPGSKLARQLIQTGNAELVEGNTWGDVFWGVCRGEGENHLGRLLMKLRRELVKP